MKHPFLPVIACLIVASTAPAEVAPVEVLVPVSKAWVGQRVAVFIELRSPGSFAGSASFDLPQLPGTLMMKIGSPVVGSKELEGTTWFVQTHEFALFPQKPGPLAVPSFTVRFARRDGFTGPANEIDADCPSFTLEVKRPPGSGDTGFLITTESLDIIEKWEPLPGPAEVGAVFKRTIIQHAPQVSGMALAPASLAAPDGIRVYPGNPATNDQVDRGDFTGGRQETITYLMQKPGNHDLPALTYAWWNPNTESLESTTLPAVTFRVAPPPPGAKPDGTTLPSAWRWLGGLALVLGLAIRQRRRLAEWAGKGWRAVNPADRVAGRKLLRACRRNDAAAAAKAWNAWQTTQEGSFRPHPELRAAITGLQRHLFGSGPTEEWHGNALACAFMQQIGDKARRTSPKTTPALPPLNPQPRIP